MTYSYVLTFSFQISFTLIAIIPKYLYLYLSIFYELNDCSGIFSVLSAINLFYIEYDVDFARLYNQC